MTDFDIRRAMETPSLIDALDIQRAFDVIVRDVQTKIDAACRVAQEKGCGVRVTSYIGTGTMKIEVCDKVPAGEIQHFDDFGSEGEFEPL